MNIEFIVLYYKLYYNNYIYINIELLKKKRGFSGSAKGYF